MGPRSGIPSHLAAVRAATAVSELAALQALLAPTGKEALEAAQSEAANEAEFLPALQRLSRRFPTPLARSALEQVLLRRRARAKFMNAERMFFTRLSLEQATAEAVAEYRATRMAGLPRVFDLGCGIGGDSLSLARRTSVVSVDHDRITLSLLQANAGALSLASRVDFVLADLRRVAWRFPPGSGALFDPSRRMAGRRARSVEAYDPPLSLLWQWLPSLESLVAKVSPGVRIEEIQHFDCEIEFISLQGELKEAALWFGSLRSARRRATLLPGPHSFTADDDPELAITSPRRFLYEPDAAILRSGLVRPLGMSLGAAQIDATIAYLTSDTLFQSPFVRAYRVLDVMPFGLKRVRAYLRARGVGKVTVKKRGSAVDTERFSQSLRLRGEGEASLVLTRVAGSKVALVVEPIPPQGEGPETRQGSQATSDVRP